MFSLRRNTHARPFPGVGTAVGSTKVSRLLRLSIVTEMVCVVEGSKFYAGWLCR